MADFQFVLFWNERLERMQILNFPAEVRVQREVISRAFGWFSASVSNLVKALVERK